MAPIHEGDAIIAEVWEGGHIITEVWEGNHLVHSPFESLWMQFTEPATYDIPAGAWGVEIHMWGGRGRNGGRSWSAIDDEPYAFAYQGGRGGTGFHASAEVSGQALSGRTAVIEVAQGQDTTVELSGVTHTAAAGGAGGGIGRNIVPQVFPGGSVDFNGVTYRGGSTALDYGHYAYGGDGAGGLYKPRRPRYPSGLAPSTLAQTQFASGMYPDGWTVDGFTFMGATVGARTGVAANGSVTLAIYTFTDWRDR